MMKTTLCFIMYRAPDSPISVELMRGRATLFPRRGLYLRVVTLVVPPCWKSKPDRAAHEISP